MADLDPENVSGFAEELNKKFRDELSSKYRVLCLSRNANNILMWGHYASSYTGVVIGIDTSVPGFATGLKCEGFEIDYVHDRSKIQLPMAYYQTPSVERYNISGQIVNSPHEEVRSDEGLIIPFSAYRTQVEDAYISALTTKFADWCYEHEVRYIFESTANSDALVSDDKQHYVAIPANALREVIVGFRADVRLVQDIVCLRRSGSIGDPKLFFTECHPYLYTMKLHETDDNYLLDHFRYNLSSM